jgi:hypothetical protein
MAEMTTTLPDYPRGITFEQVWAALEKAEKRNEEYQKRREEEDQKRQEESRKRNEESRKRHAEFELEMKKSREEFDRRMKETGRKISQLGDRFGEMIQYMVMPNLVDKFRDLGFVFTKAYPEAEIKDKKNNIIAEIDITLEDGDTVMIVEVKSKPNTADITEHIERMEKVKKHADLHGDKRKFLGAVAGMVMKENVKAFVLKNGFFAVEPSGETFIITPPDGKPRAW